MTAWDKCLRKSKKYYSGEKIVKTITTIIFDLDGTLLDTSEDLCDAVNYVMDKYKFPRRTLDEERSFVGHGIKQLIRLSVPEGEANPLFEDAYAAFMDYYVDNCKIKTHVYPGMKELLTVLKQENYKMAIVSNKNYKAVNEIKDFYLQEFFDVAIGERDGVRKKPAPDTVLTALKSLERKPEETIYVGDSDVDWQTAVNVGVPSVLCSWGFRPRAVLEALQPYALIDAPEELLEVLKQIQSEE